MLGAQCGLLSGGDLSQFRVLDGIQVHIPRVRHVEKHVESLLSRLALLFATEDQVDLRYKKAVRPLN